MRYLIDLSNGQDLTHGDFIVRSHKWIETHAWQYLLCKADFIAWYLRHLNIGNAERKNSWDLKNCLIPPTRGEPEWVYGKFDHWNVNVDMISAWLSTSCSVSRPFLGRSNRGGRLIRLSWLYLAILRGFELIKYSSNDNTGQAIIMIIIDCLKIYKTTEKAKEFIKETSEWNWQKVKKFSWSKSPGRYLPGRWTFIIIICNSDDTTQSHT